MPSHYTKENSFILNSLKRVVSRNHKGEIVQPDDDLNWDYIVATSDLNGVIPLVSKVLNLYDRDSLPQGITETFSEINRESAVSNLIKLKELHFIFKKLMESGIDSVVLKGAGLGIDLYGDLSLRPFGDLDILVYKQHLENAVDILKQCDYEYIFDYTPKQADLYKQSSIYLTDQDVHYSFFNQVKKIPLELHWELMAKKYSFSQDVENIFENSKTVTTGQGDISILSDEDLILYLSLHGSKHFWSRLIWIFDVAAFINKKRDINWELVIAKSEELNCRRNLLTAVSLAEKMLDVKPPNVFEGYLDNDTKISELTNKVDEIYTNIYDLEIIESENKTFFLNSMESYTDKLCFVSDLIFKPTIYEVEVVNLPRKISFLYYLIRPLRLTKKYISRFFSNK